MKAMSALVEQAGALLKETRIEKGLTLEDVGEKLGVNRSTISRYEGGQQNLTLETVERVMSAMGKAVRLVAD